VAEGIRVKICGLRRREDVLAADSFGADYLGVVLTAGFARSVDPGLATEILEGVAAIRVAVLVDESVAAAEARGKAIGAGVLQLVWMAFRARVPDDLLL
jgi:phosphoribosylanthranilate isomerase